MLRRTWLVAVTAVVVIALDALAKQWALGALQMGQSQPFVPGFLQFTLTTNTGGAFGIGHEMVGLMKALPIVICGGIIYWIWKRDASGEHLSRIEQIGFGMLLGGALGNIADRLFRGRVTDFLEFTWVQFPVFNVADALIDTGIILLIIASLMPSTNAAPNRQQADVNG